MGPGPPSPRAAIARPPAGIVLAGGVSRRFGSDKLRLAVDGRSLLDRAIHAVATLGGPVVLSVAAGDLVTRSIGTTGTVLVEDPVAGGGPLVGLAAALDVALGLGVDRAVVVGGDMPWLVPNVLRRLAGGVGDPTMVRDEGERPEIAPLIAAACLPVVDGSPRPLPMALLVEPASRAAHRALDAGSRSLLALVDGLLVDRFLAARLEEVEWRVLDPEGRTFADIDQPEDLPGA